jgi:hypothetical protein
MAKLAWKVYHHSRPGKSQGYYYTGTDEKGKVHHGSGPFPDETAARRAMDEQAHKVVNGGKK